MDYNNSPLRIKDGDDILTISYDDVVKYHGYSMIGGVALAYKIMLWGFPKLTDEIPERGHFSFLSGIGLGGQGVIDATEMVMRVRSKGIQRYVDHIWVEGCPYCGSEKTYLLKGNEVEITEIEV